MSDKNSNIQDRNEDKNRKKWYFIPISVLWDIWTLIKGVFLKFPIVIILLVVIAVLIGIKLF